MKKIFELENLDCANCAAKIEDAVRKIVGVEAVQVSFMTQKMSLEAVDEKFEEIVNQVEKIMHDVEEEVTLVRK